jgi:hypothetical protein
VKLFVSQWGVRTFGIALVVALVAGVAQARVVMPPGIQRSCRGPSTWAELAKCVKPYADTPLPARPASIVTILRDRARFQRSYVFFRRSDGKWQLQATLAAGDYDVIGLHKLKSGKTALDRIDLFGHESDRTTTVHRKIALVCNDDGCSEEVYACTALVRGRAVETFAGEVAVSSEGAITVIGDRSQSGALCP